MLDPICVLSKGTVVQADIYSAVFELLSSSAVHVWGWSDLAPAFDWNIKQLFVFLVVEYQTTKNVSSHFVGHGLRTTHE
jgi:hypothetical protein